MDWPVDKVGDEAKLRFTAENAATFSPSRVLPDVGNRTISKFLNLTIRRVWADTDREVGRHALDPVPREGARTTPLI
jgi:hypothetical protein